MDSALTLMRLALVLSGCLYLPGLVANWFLGLRRYLALAAAPQVSVLIMIASGVAARILGYGWSLWFFLGFTVIALASLWLVTALIVGQRRLRPGWYLASPAAPTYSGKAFAYFLLFTVATAIAAALPILTQWNLFLPAEQIDSTFHQNLAWSIAASGNASIFDAASPAYGLRAFPTYYPISWHALIAVVGGTANVVPATNLLVIFTFCIWFTGLGALALETFPRSFSASCAVVIAGLLFPAFPMYMVAARQLWPNALGYAMLPGLLAVTIHMLRSTKLLQKGTRGHFFVLLLAVVLSLAGATATYPSTLFSFIVVASMPLLLFFSDVVVTLKRTRGWKWAVGAVFAAIFIPWALGFAVLTWHPGIALFVRRTPFANFENIRGKLWSLGTLWPSAAGMPYFIAAATVIIAIIGFGLWFVMRCHDLRWVGFGWIAGFIVLAAAYFPIPYLTRYTGLWYNDPYRIIPILIPFICLMAGAVWQRGRPHLEGFVMERINRPSAHRYIPTVSLVTFGLIFALATTQSRTQISHPTYAYPNEGLVFLADEAELQMIRKVGPKLDPELLLIGDPANGSTYMQALGNHRVVFPHITYRDLDTDARYLSRYLKDIHSDARVCEIIRHYAIGYFYEDKPGRIEGLEVEQRSPGLYNVDTSKGFELVAQEGNAKIYRITACGPLQNTRDDWQIQPPYEPLYNIFGQKTIFDPESGLPKKEQH